ncbi:hypothetical protein ACFLT1_04895 [Bacteroidota bacterium]
MKKLHFKTGLTLLLAVMFLGTASYAQKAEKEISNDYSISKGYTLDIENKYGSIEIVNWDQDELSVVVHIEVEAASQAKADKLLESIEINISEEGKGVNYETKIGETKLGNKTKIKVAYEVKAPAYMNVDLEQAYGNIFLQAVTGEAHIEVRYGDLDATSIVRDDNEMNMIEIAYGNASIEQVGKLGVELAYSNLTVKESAELNIESKYSNLTLGDIVKLELESKYDKVKASSLEESASIEAAYTNVTLGTISSGFKTIQAEMAFGNLEAELAPGASFRIDASASFGSIKIPDGDYSSTKEHNVHTVSGKIGDNPSAVVEAEFKYGSLKLK